LEREFSSSAFLVGERMEACQQQKRDRAEADAHGPPYAANVPLERVCKKGRCFRGFRKAAMILTCGVMRNASGSEHGR
jgi:hypothetical protein